MPRLKHEEKIDFSRWSARLFRCVCACAFVVFLAEAANYALNELNGELDGGSLAFITKNIAVPSSVNISVLAATAVLLRYFIRKKLQYFQAIALIGSAVAICICLTVAHYDIGPIYAIFCFPILLSMAYIDMRPLALATALSFTAYALVGLIINPARFPGETIRDYGETLSICAFLATSYLVARLTVARLSDLVDSVAEKDRLARLDSLTSLLNHATFYEELDALILAHNSSGNGFSVAVWDIDDFKKINDRYGHDVGDRVIKSFAEAVKTYAVEDEKAFRYGGEEFTLLTYKSAAETELLSRRIRADFTRKCGDLGLGDPVTASAGICRFDRRFFHGKREFFAAADRALYAAKAEPGKNADIIWDKSLDAVPIEKGEYTGA